MGSDGDQTDGDVVKTGPFREGEWETVNGSGGAAGPLTRQFARSGDAIATGWTTLPIQNHVNDALGRTPYDASPWHRSSNPSFRNELEGWIGEGLHNRVHVWVGGDMLPGTSPNDPVFFLHHCFVDKIWADWQADNPSEDYLPQTGGPAGHNVGDAMYPWSTTPADVLDHRQFGLYDTDPPEIGLDPATSLTFQDVPEGETTYRATVFDVLTCSSVTIAVVAGPSSPFTVLQSSVVVNPGRDAVLGEARLWIGYTGTTDGDSASGSVTIRVLETGEEWTLPITANTVARPTAAIVLALDQSGSMDNPSGVANFKRIEVLRYSAAPFVELIQEGNGIGIARFDHDAYPTMGITGPLGPPGPFDTDRPTASGHISTHSTNPAGLTAIGDALELAHNMLVPETGYDVKATIVFTDGHETASKRINDVTGLIDERIYAIGLGTAEQIQPTALTDLTNGSGGYVYLTGELNDDLYFRLAKYFLQVLAGVTNEDIVVDPQGWLKPGMKKRIPFNLSETDISSDVILLSPAPWAFRFWLETPDGDLIDPSNTLVLPAVDFVLGQHSAYYRMTLPVPVGSGGAREGEPPQVYRRVKLSKDEPYDTTQTYPVLYG